MPLLQTFLPIITDDNRILGMVPIPSTVFDGTETSISVNGVDTPVRQVVTSLSTYMAAKVTPQQERSNFDSAAWLASFIPYGWWNNQLGIAYKVERETPFVQLLRGINVSGVSYGNNPPPVPTTPTTPAYLADWGVVCTMQGPQNSFADLVWVNHFTEMFPGEIPTHIALGALVADPSGGANPIRVFLIQSGVPIVNSEAQFDTLRFVKITSGNVALGRYSWEVYVTATSGKTFPILASLENK